MCVRAGVVYPKDIFINKKSIELCRVVNRYVGNEKVRTHATVGLRQIVAAKAIVD